MSNFATHVAGSRDLTREEQRRAGAPVAGTMDEKHKAFLETVKRLIETGEIDPYKPKTFIKEDVYATLSEEWLEKVDLALINIAGLLKQIYEFYISKETVNESLQYVTMIEQLFAMKQRIEEHYDVFKF